VALGPPNACFELRYSLSAERPYVHWVRWFVRFHGLRHPRDMGAAEVEAFLSWLGQSPRRNETVFFGANQEIR
jgi:hypothetical protein